MKKVIVCALLVFGSVFQASLGSSDKQYLYMLQHGNKKLNGANFSNQTLIGTNFSGVQLQSSNFEGAKFLIKTAAETLWDTGGVVVHYPVYPNFSGANLTGANFSNTYFASKNKQILYWEHYAENGWGLAMSFSNAMAFRNLAQKYTNAQQINFSGANLTNANFSNAHFTQLNKTPLNFSKAILKSAKFANAKIGAVNCSGANLTSADFSNAQFSVTGNRSSNFSGTNLTGAHFAKAYLGALNLNNAIVGSSSNNPDYGTNFTGANLAGSDFSKIKGKKLLNVDFGGAVLTSVNFEGVEFGWNVQLAGANFYNGKLQKAIFKKVNPIGAQWLVLALFKSDNKDGVQDVLNNGYVIATEEMDKLGAHFTLSKGKNFTSQIQTLEKSYKSAAAAATLLTKSKMAIAAATEVARAASLKKQIASLKQKQVAELAQVESKENSTGQGVITKYMAGLGQKLIDALAKSDSATALKLANQAGQITLKQLGKYLNLYQSPLQYTTSNNQEPLIMAIKMNFPNVAKAILEGLQTTIGKTQALVYINTLNPFSIVMDSFMSGGDTTIAAQIAQTLIDTGIPVPPIPPLISRLKAAGIKNVELAEVAGDFKQQCRNLKLDTQKNYLWGECKKLNGDYNGATWVSPVLPITLSDGTQYTPFIGNRNGGLFDYNYQNGTPLVKGDFWKSCWSIRYDQESNGVYAVCGKGQGYISPALPVTLPDGTNYVPNIVEYNKRLTDKNYQDGKGPVQGTFWKSCMNVRLGIKNNVIYGLCGKGLSNIGPAMPVKLANGKTYTPLVGEYSGKLLDFNYKDGKGILKGDFWKYCENIIFYIERGLVTYTYQENGKSKSGALGNVKPGDALGFKNGKLVKEK